MDGKCVLTFLLHDKPTEYYNTKKLEQSLGLDRKLTVREIAMNILGFDVGECRLPLYEMSETNLAKLKAAIDEVK